MSKSEDYLDQLLNGLSDDDNANTGDMTDFRETGDAEKIMDDDDILKSFADEMIDSDGADEFLRQFEKELMGQSIETENEQKESEDAFAGLDGLIDDMKTHMQSGEEFEDINQALASGIPDLLVAEEPMGSMDDLMVNTMDEEPAPETTGGEDDLMALLKSDSDFSDIGSILQADEDNSSLADESLFDDFASNSMSEAENILNDSFGIEEDVPEEENGKKKKMKKKKEKVAGGEKSGFFAKLGTLLFGDDDEEEEKVEKVSVAPVATSIEELSDENLALLKEFASSTPEPEPEPEKPKKEKKKKEKKEKPKKEKKPKVKKEKKPKPPKEPDNTPPLPRVPVLLTFIMAASILALVILGTNLLGYSNGFSDAKRAYEQAEYCEAFRQVSGMEIKEADMEVYEKYRIMALVASEYESYESMMAAEQYDMALDSLIRAVGRCDKHSADAETYGCAKEFGQMNAKILEELETQFGVSEEEALALYAYGEEREDYSIQIYAILENIGLEKVTEE